MPTAGDQVTCRLVGTLAGQPIINNLSFTLITAEATWSEQVTAIGAALDASLGIISGTGVWFAGRSEDYHLTELQVVDVKPGTNAMGFVACTGAGAAVGESLPPNDCLCMTLRSSFKGQSGRGRIYLSGIREADAVSGFLSADVQDAASGLGSALLTGFGETAGAAIMRWCVLHRVSHGVRLVPPEVKPIMSFTIHNEVRSLGRRAMGRRIHRTRHTV